MIERDITPRLFSLFQQYPFVTLTGPRQSGKTTLCRTAFPHLAYVNLEAPDQRGFAESDPRRFLSQFGEGAILDEIQHVPELLSYLQVLADEDGRNGLFILTGSEQFQLSDAVSQSLAGRTALLRLLPFSLGELRRTGTRTETDEILYSGFYPRIHDQGLEPRQALGDYFETYVERDVRRIGEVRNLSSFRRFVQLCAGRIGQLTNLSSIGADAGVSHTTAREWLTILETSYIVYQLQPFHANIRKRLVRSPKLYFYDVGLASYLIGIERASQIATHPLRGPLFENAVVAEVLKHSYNRGERPNLSFYRDSRGLECDLLYQTSYGTNVMEVKAGSTPSSSYFGSMNRVAELIHDVAARTVVYGGTTRQSRSNGEIIPLDELPGHLERFEASDETTPFIRERNTPYPTDSTVAPLDVLFQSHIKPTLDGLDAELRLLAEDLTLRLVQRSYVEFDERIATFGSFVLQRNWDQAMNHYLANRQSDFNSHSPVELRHHFRFSTPPVTGGPRFSVDLWITWDLNVDNVTRLIAIDGHSIPQLSSVLPCSELVKGSPDTENTIELVCGIIATRINRLSHGLGR